MKIATHYFLTHTKYILLNSLKKTMKNLVFDRKFRFPFVHWVLFTYIVGERLKKRWTHITVWTCNWTVIYRSDPVFRGQVTTSMTSSINLKCKLQLYTMSRKERKVTIFTTWNCLVNYMLEMCICFRVQNWGFQNFLRSFRSNRLTFREEILPCFRIVKYSGSNVRSRMSPCYHFQLKASRFYIFWSNTSNKRNCFWFPYQLEPKIIFIQAH